MKIVTEIPSITLNKELFDASGKMKNPAADLAPFAGSITAALAAFAEKFEESTAK